MSSPSAPARSAVSLTPVVVGVDVATSTVRVLCVDAEGTVRGEGRADLPQPVRDERGRSEQEARAWWPATARALRQATAQLPHEGGEVSAVAVSATSGTFVLADRDGEPLGPALMYDDRRGAEFNSRAQEAGSARWRSLGLTVGPTAALGRVAWWAALARAGPGAATAAADRRAARALADGLEQGARVLHPPDVIGEALTGAAVVTDWSHALKTGYDPRAGEWPDEVLEELGVPRSWLPAVRAPGAAAGRVSATAAAESGLPEGCPVRLGMTDGCAGQLATGAVRPGQFVGVLGTTYVLKGVTRELVTDPGGAFYSHRHPEGWWLPGGASNTGGEALGAVHAEDLARLDEAARAHGPASCVSYPLQRQGERFPFVSTDARGFTVGRPAGEAERHRSALEGVAFLERLAVERMGALGMAVNGPLYAAGGGSRSELWCRIRASVLGQPLWVAERAETAFGAALLAAAGTLHGSLEEAAAAMTGEGRLVEPVATEQDAMAESYARFVTALRDRGWLTEASEVVP